jgi:hypothetical protein
VVETPVVDIPLAAPPVAPIADEDDEPIIEIAAAPAARETTSKKKKRGGKKNARRNKKAKQQTELAVAIDNDDDAMTNQMVRVDASIVDGSVEEPNLAEGSQRISTGKIQAVLADGTDVRPVDTRIADEVAAEAAANIAAQAAANVTAQAAANIADSAVANVAAQAAANVVAQAAANVVAQADANIVASSTMNLDAPLVVASMTEANASATEVNATDASAIDANANATDASAIDAGAINAGAIDAGAIDAGAIDAGAIDTSDSTVVAGSWQPTMPPISTTPSVPWRRPAMTTTSPTYSIPTLVIDDADPESADRERDDRGAGKETRLSFLPPILLDREDRSARQGGLTLAIIVLLIAATLTLSYLMRRPSASGDGVTMLDGSSELLS